MVRVDRVVDPSIVRPILLLALAGALVAPVTAQEAEPGAADDSRVGSALYPGETWMQYADVSDAGFSLEALTNARRFWEKRSAASFLAVSGGAVVASWGDVDRRFPSHSMRKSFLSALYGVFRDDIDLGLTLAELEIDDVPALTEQEKQARILDLLLSRSGVYHPAAAEPTEMSSGRPDRGDHLPGTHWWYNNWDFNVAGTVFRRLTGEDIFEAFAERIAEPIGMQDYRLMDGFYYHEPEKSLHSAYLFRMSTRDLARFGLLFARGGQWRGEQIVPGSWVTESTRAHSGIDLGEEYGTGYGYMWWVQDGQGFSARGYGGHVLAVYPELDLVMVIRADTYHDRFISNRAIARLFGMVLRAAGGERSGAPRLVPLPPSSTPAVPIVPLPPEQWARYTGEWTLESGRTVSVGSLEGMLTIDYGLGLYRLFPESETRFHMEDAGDPVLFELDTNGRVTGVWAEQLAYLEAADAVRRNAPEVAVAWVEEAAKRFPESARVHFNLARAFSGIARLDEAEDHLRTALTIDPDYRDASSLLRRLQVRRHAWVIAATGLLVLVMVGVGLGRLRRRGVERAE